jgi:hypothetical protein
MSEVFHPLRGGGRNDVAGAGARATRTPDGSRRCPSRNPSLGGGCNERKDRCPVSLDLVRQHVADLQRARFAETASSWLSH